MAGPQSFLANESDRLWVSLYDGFSRMSVPLFIIVSAYLLVPMKEEQTMWQFYRRRFLKVLPPFFVFMILYSTLPLLWGQIDGATSLKDLSRIFLNFPTLAGHLWFMYPLLSLYLFIPIISPWLRNASAKEERFFILLFALSTCMPYISRWCGELWGQCFWNEYHLLWYFSGYLGYLVMAHYIRVHLDWSRKKRLGVGVALWIIGAGASRSGNRSFHAGLGDWVGDVYHQLRDNYGRCFPGIHLHRAGKGSASGDGDVEAELWRLSDAHILAWSVGRHL